MSETVNIHETDGRSVTGVLPEIDLTPENTRRGLTALRTKHGADTPIGHRCSNLIEMIENPYPPVVMIRRQMSELQALLAAR